MLSRSFARCQQLPLRNGVDLGSRASQRVSVLLNNRYNSSASSSSSPPPSSSAVQVEKVVSGEKAKEDDDELPFLPRPLGIFDRPTTLQKSWKESTLELMDQDVRLERRRHMCERFPSVFSSLVSQQ